MKTMKQLEEEIVDRFDYYKRDLALAKATAGSALFKQIARTACEVTSLNEKDTVWTYVSGSTMCMTVSLYGLDGLKDPRLENVLNRFMNVREPRELKTTDYPTNLERDYSFRWDGIYIVVEAHFKDDSATCKKVIKGYTEAMAPQPIYGLDCEGDEVQG